MNPIERHLPALKVCGIQTLEEALAIAQLGAAYLGVVFESTSKRYVKDLEMVSTIISTLAELHPACNVVGVFTEHSESTMIQIIEKTGLRYLQLHGIQSRAVSQRLSEFQNIHQIFVISVDALGTFDSTVPGHLSVKRDFLLFDGLKGGSGVQVNYQNIAMYPELQKFRCFLAGGLSAKNIGKVLSVHSPYAVDVSSSVEHQEGFKDMQKIKEMQVAMQAPIKVSPHLIGSLDPITYYGQYGGQYVPESLIAPMQVVTEAFHFYKTDPSFCAELDGLLKDYAGRPTALTEVKRFAEYLGLKRVFLKREDLLHTGAHKINNAIGQCLLAKKMGKKRVIAETGAGQHGVATATACAHMDLECVIYMGSVDMARQKPNVDKIRLLGAKVISVDEGDKTLKSAVNAALRDFVESFEETHYCLGSALGPAPYPEMVAFFHRVIGEEARLQCLLKTNQLPSSVIACIGGGSNAIGIFSEFLSEDTVQLYGVEAAGKGLHTGAHAAKIGQGSPGVLHGCYSYLLQDEFGQIKSTHSISAGLDYPMIGPQHAQLFESGRVHYVSAEDKAVLSAFQLLAKLEGIIPALESAHALAYVMTYAETFKKDEVIIINLSGRGDKDMLQVQKL